MEGGLDGFFTCEDYQIDEYEYKGVKQLTYCLKTATTDFDLTGQIIWDAARLLAGYIIDNQESFKGKNVVELGAGAGLSGLVAANYANTVILTDHNETVLKLIQMNAEKSERDNVFVQKFEWGNDKLKDIKLENSFKKTVDFSKEKLDILVGADVIYWPQYLPDLFQTIKEALTTNPDCLVLIAFCSRKKDVDDRLAQKIDELGLEREFLVKEDNKYVFRITEKKASKTESL